jgi:hypothetical protein
VFERVVLGMLISLLVDFLCLILVKKYILLHLLEIHFIIESNYVFCVTCLLIYHTFSINLCDVFFA